MTLILNSWESMVIALYDVVLKILESPLTPKVLHLPFIKALSFINLIFKKMSFFHLTQHLGILGYSPLEITK